MKKQQLNILIENFKDAKKEVNIFNIDKTNYIVTSHFIGNKNINEVLNKLAIKQAYQDISKIFEQ